MQSEYQKPRANLKAVQREVDRLREIESEHQYTQKRPEFLLELFSDLNFDLSGVLHRILERLPEILPDANFGIGLLEGMAGQVSRAVANDQTFKAQVENESKYRALVDNLPAAIFETIPAGDVRFFNDAGLAINGYSIDEISSLAAEDLYVDPEEWLHLSDALRHKGHRADEFQIRRKDRCAVRIRGANGGILSYFGYHGDIIEEYPRREEEYLLRHLRELIGAMEEEGAIQSVPVAVAT